MSNAKKIVVLGAGESGVGAAILAHKQGMETWVSDKGKIKSKYVEILQREAIPFEEGTHTEDIILKADEVIKSPGIPEKAPLVQKLKSKNIPVISEIEFAFRYTDAKLICVTGSNDENNDRNKDEPRPFAVSVTKKGNKPGIIKLIILNKRNCGFERLCFIGSILRQGIDAGCLPVYYRLLWTIYFFLYPNMTIKI